MQGTRTAALPERPSGMALPPLLAALAHDGSERVRGLTPSNLSAGPVVLTWLLSPCDGFSS